LHDHDVIRRLEDLHLGAVGEQPRSRNRPSVKFRPPLVSAIVLGKDAVQYECVDVHVQIERPAEPLENGHRTPTTIGHIVQLCTTTQPTQHRTHVDGDDGTAQVVVPRQPIAQAIRQTQDPLPHGPRREERGPPGAPRARPSDGRRNLDRTPGLYTRRPPADPGRTPYSETARSRLPATRSAGSPGTPLRRTAAGPRHPAGSRPVYERSRSAPARSCRERPRRDAGVRSARTAGPRAAVTRLTCQRRDLCAASVRKPPLTDVAVSALSERRVVSRSSLRRQTAAGVVMCGEKPVHQERHGSRVDPWVCSESHGQAGD